MIIRLATLHDIDNIMQLVRALMPVMQAAGNFQWNDQYPNPQVFQDDVRQNQLWLAEIDGQVAGVAALTTEQYPEYADAGLDLNETAIVVHRLAVSPNFQGRGVAAALLQQAEQLSIDKGYHLLRIDTNSENKSAQKLFLKAGYVFQGEIGLSFKPGQRFYCYQKRI